MSLAALTAKLARGEAVILDGGMGTEIKRRGFAAGSSELSVAAMLESRKASGRSTKTSSVPAPK